MEFYAAWLDRQMVYSCAYFSATEDLDAAKAQKLDFLFIKLRLRRSEQLLDVECGWSAPMVHAVRHYRIFSRGVTLSENQAGFSQELSPATRLLADRPSEM